MKPLRKGVLPAALLSAVAIAIGGLKIPTTVAIAAATSNSISNPSNSSQTENSLQLTQVDSLCRRVTVGEGLAVRQRPDPNAPQIGGVDYNSAISLVSGAREIPGPDGRVWLEIASPVRGYISNGEPGSEGNIGLCYGSSIPPQSVSQSTPNNLCRKIEPRVAPQGIAVHADASRFSTSRGGLAPGGQVLLAPNYQAIPDKNGERRTWIEIVSPVAGFISTESLIMCGETTASAVPTASVFNTQTPPVSNGSLCRQVEGRVAPQGLAIRADASEFSTYLGGVPAEGRLTLVPNYTVIRDRNGESRNWVQISSPVAGFVSADNLIMCR